MDEAAEACELQTCECFEALGEVLYKGESYDASCWTSTYGGVSMTLAEQINHCGYSGKKSCFLDRSQKIGNSKVSHNIIPPIRRFSNFPKILKIQNMMLTHPKRLFMYE